MQKTMRTGLNKTPVDTPLVHCSVAELLNAMDLQNRSKNCVVEIRKGYFINEKGEIFSYWKQGKNHKYFVDYSIIPKKLTPSKNKLTRYYKITLKEKNNLVTYDLHRLVCEAFKGKCPKGMLCSHLDGTRTNNHKDNLIWETQTQNLLRTIKHGTDTVGVNNKMAKLNKKEVNEIKVLLKSRMFQKDIKEY